MAQQNASAHETALLVAVAAFLAAVFLTACGTSESAPPAEPESTTVVSADLPALRADRIAAGRALYSTYCASCHGNDLEGADNWQLRNDDGSYPPPPQDSSGHTWHHSDRLLVDLIANGSGFDQSRMPLFGDVLSEDEILSILDFFKSTWGDQERRFQWDVTRREEAGG